MARAKAIWVSLVASVVGAGLIGIISLRTEVEQHEYTRQAKVRLGYALHYRQWKCGAGALTPTELQELLAGLGKEYGHAAGLQRDDESLPVDGWGKPFSLRALPAQGVEGVYALEVRSAGPDGEFGSADDSVEDTTYVSTKLCFIEACAGPGACWGFLFIDGGMYAKACQKPSGSDEFYMLVPGEMTESLRRQVEYLKTVEGAKPARSESSHAVRRAIIPTDAHKPIIHTHLDVNDKRVRAAMDALSLFRMNYHGTCRGDEFRGEIGLRYPRAARWLSKEVPWWFRSQRD